jgi:hypothetical protein
MRMMKKNLKTQVSFQLPNNGENKFMCRHIVVDYRLVLGKYLEYVDICLRYHLCDI